VSACTTDEALYAKFFHELLDRGVAIAPGAYEVMFPGLAHDDEVLTAISDAAHAAAVAVASH
jgi:glutamate-1-semialdehyde 2,1-aminomutase